MSNASSVRAASVNARSKQAGPTQDLPSLVESVTSELKAGLRHGFFKLTIECELTSNRKRQVTLGVAKTQRFVIPEEELE